MKNRFSVNQLIQSVSMFGVAFACYRAYGSRWDGLLDLLLVIGFCCALGGAVGVLWNRVGTGAALGFAGFLIGCVLRAAT